MKKSIFGHTFCMVSIIVCSVFYALFSWIASFFGLYFFIMIGSSITWTVGMFFYIASATLLLITPLVCILGITLAIRSMRKADYVHSFLRQLLPFATLFWSLVFFVVAMFVGN